MSVFVPDNKQVVGFQVVIFVKIGVKKNVQHLLRSFGVVSLAYLPMIDVAPSASGFDGEFVVVGQILSNGNTAAALGVISGQAD